LFKQWVRTHASVRPSHQRVSSIPDGKTYRPSMFVTLTLGSYGRVTAEGVPVDPERYDYRRAALDALHFPKLVDRFWQNLRRCAGYQVRTSPHLSMMSGLDRN
jgi:hypothetical protein